eukprot:TRINITY_DN292_c0_g1_i10.p1 TRINITY_DN292_c0_g1~~TRINITY_DN292_c0_g1_i10.p1  ORF type:complete len:316 (-),score=54.46 TRINITY_DN292_c0_g1_i10:397-1272(-)
MALKLYYRSTFVDVDDETSVLTKLRSQSQPPLTRLRDDLADARFEENQLSNYVATLGQRSEQLGMLIRISGDAKDRALLPEPDVRQEGEKQERSGTLSTRSPCSSFRRIGHCRTPSSASTATSLQHVESEVGTAGVEKLPSRGSMGHPEVCRRPCIYFARGECQNGSDCGYCHMDHDGRSAHLDKRNRDLLKKLSSADVLPLVLKLARSRALDIGILSEAAEVLRVLENWSLTKLSATFQTPEMRRLDCALKTLPFSGLITIVLKKHQPAKSQVDDAFADQLQEALAKIRM